MFMDTRARCFIEAAKCLNFTRAAENLYISQPALSKNIAALEEECRMKLFYRDPRQKHVKLTPAGAVILKDLLEVQKALDDMMEKARAAETGQDGKLVIALLLGQIFNDTVRAVLAEIAEKYPKIEIDKIVGSYSELREWLDDGTADMIVTFEEEARMVKDTLYEEVEIVQLGYAVPRSNHLIHKKKISISDLASETMIFPDERETVTIFNNFEEKCLNIGFAPKKKIAVNLNSMNMMAEMGQGILITKEDSMVTRSPNLKFIKSDELGKIKMVAAWKKDNLNPIITFYHRMYEDYYRGKKESS